MNDTTPKTPALTRTWKAMISHVIHGENWGTDTHTVTLTRPFVGGPLAATVDDQPATVERAVRILESAYDTEVLTETLATEPTPATLGKTRAHKLHKIMGRLGLYDHYGIARRAAGLDECYSLATLTEHQAREVWRYLLNLFPQDARRAAA